MVNFTEIPILYSQQSTKMDSSLRYVDLLPEEIITDEVLMQTQYPDLLNFCQTSKRAARICQDEFFWKRKVRRDLGTRFPDVHKDEPTHTKTWKGEYNHYYQVLQGELFNRATYGPVKDLQDLLDFGVNPNFRLFGHTPLMRAAWKGRLELVQLLVEGNANVNIQDSQEGQTALDIASDAARFTRMGTHYIKIMKYLKAQGGLRTLDGKLAGPSLGRLQDKPRVSKSRSIPRGGDFDWDE